MPEFQYNARELSGREVSGVLTAGSEQEVLSTLAGRSLFPTKIALAQKAERQRKAVGKRVSSRHLVTFYSQLADLLHSGVPLLRSLEVLEQQASHPTIAAVLQDVRQQVADGTRLADSLRRHPQVFGELAVSMVRAGEEGGFLEDVLKQVATFTEHQEELKARVVGAMAYPAFLAVACIVVVAGMLIFLVPKFAPIFERLAAAGELPTPTKILMAGSDFLKVYGIWVVAALIGGGWYGLQKMKTEAGRRFVDKWRLKAKGIGPIVRSLAVARFCRILGTLLRNGVPILNSLRIAKDATGNVLLSEAIGSAADNISAGKSLAKPLAASGQFSSEVVEMITVGEEANNLEQVLLNIADNMERRTYRQLELFVRLLEPSLLLVMAVVIVFVMIALLLPVFKSAGGGLG
ncbi:MAG TPA: type II secretion system F family protein [Planctomycetaceae bacterium]|nr:type II secretion system F family protein [Planctomycetaceae bacterium]